MHVKKSRSRQDGDEGRYLLITSVYPVPAFNPFVQPLPPTCLVATSMGACKSCKCISGNYSAGAKEKERRGSHCSFPTSREGRLPIAVKQSQEIVHDASIRDADGDAVILHFYRGGWVLG